MKKNILLLIITLCICFFTGCGNENKIQTKTETEIETENPLFDQLEGITKITVMSYGHKYVTEDEKELNRIVTYLKRVELEPADYQGILYGEAAIVDFYSGEEVVMSVGSDNDQNILIGDVRYHRVSKKSKETLAGIFRNIWENYGEG